MITVRFTRGTVAEGQQRMPGAIVDLQDHEARLMIAMGKAVKADTSKPEPPKPITTDDFRPKRGKPGK